MIDLGPASSNPERRACFVRHEIAYRAGARRAQGRWHFPSRSTVINRDTELCLVAWCNPISMIFAVSDAAFYPQLAKSSAKLVVMHSVQDGQADRRSVPAGDIMDHIAAFTFDARIAALTGAGIKL